MNRLFDTDNNLDTGYSDTGTADREISLGTSTILGIFFALAVICGGFFAFGYTLGRRSLQPPTPPIISSTSPSNIPLLPAKPAAGTADSPAPPTTQIAIPEPATTDTTLRLTNTSASKTPATLLPPAPAVAAAGNFMVQVAAVSSPDIASILINSLKKHGYTVGIYHEAQDKLLHVQIGPFASRKDAEAMRDHVLADGFNAIVK